MLHLATTLALAPLLVWQGRRVRATALELPEAPGPRSGRVGPSPTPFRLLVIGDSAAAGVGVPSQDHAITGCLVQALMQSSTGTTKHTGSVEWRLIARTGHRLSHVIREVEGASLEWAPVEGHTAAPRTDLVVVSAGINDVLQGTSPARWLAGLQRLADELERSAAPRRVAFSGIPRIQDFPLLPQPLAWYLGRCAQRLNRATLDFIEKQAPISWRYVKLDLPLTPDFLAHDCFHPNEASCRLWCEQVMAATLDEHAGSDSGRDGRDDGNNDGDGQVGD